MSPVFAGIADPLWTFKRLMVKININVTKFRSLTRRFARNSRSLSGYLGAGEKTTLLNALSSARNCEGARPQSARHSQPDKLSSCPQVATPIFVRARAVSRTRRGRWSDVETAASCCTLRDRPVRRVCAQLVARGRGVASTHGSEVISMLEPACRNRCRSPPPSLSLRAHAARKPVGVRLAGCDCIGPRPRPRRSAVTLLPNFAQPMNGAGRRARRWARMTPAGSWQSLSHRDQSSSGLECRDSALQQGDRSPVLQRVRLIARPQIHPRIAPKCRIWPGLCCEDDFFGCGLGRGCSTPAVRKVLGYYSHRALSLLGTRCERQGALTGSCGTHVPRAEGTYGVTSHVLRWPRRRLRGGPGGAPHPCAVSQRRSAMTRQFDRRPRIGISGFATRHLDLCSVDRSPPGRCTCGVRGVGQPLEATTR